MVLVKHNIPILSFQLYRKDRHFFDEFSKICAMVFNSLRIGKIFVTLTDSEKSLLNLLCIEDAERVGDPILFERYYVCNRENAHWGLRAPSR